MSDTTTGTRIDVAAVTAHICSKIREATVIREPWPHLVIEEFLPPQVFDALVGALPEEWLRMNSADPRSWIVVNPDCSLTHSEDASKAAWEGQERGRPVIRDVFAAIGHGRELLSALRDLLKTELREALALFKARYEKQEVKIRQSTRVMRDAARYTLSPHTDVPGKLVSIVLYLRADEGARLGTILYEPVQEGFTCKGLTYHDVNLFRAISMVPFTPNSAFVFVRTDRTFHGVRFETGGSAPFSRVTLQSNFWLGDEQSLNNPARRTESGTADS